MLDNEFLKNFMDKMRLDEQSYNKLHSAIIGGSNKVAHNVVTEAISVDDDWINVLENSIYSIEQIVRNPRKFIIEEENIVDVGRAKRVNAKTVRHLSANTQYIQNISDEGDVQPSKVLVSELQEDVAIYENRFVCSLVERLVTFTEQRYRDLSQKLNVFENTDVGFHSDFKLGHSQFECELKLKVKEPPRDKALTEKNNETMRRLENIRARLRAIQGTPLMRLLRTKKPVRPPIQKTNMLRMNVDYSTCYKLWLYIQSYKFVGYSVEVQEKNLPVEGDYYDDLTVIAALSAQAALTDKVLRRGYYDRLKGREPKQKKYKVLTKIDFTPTFGSDNSSAGAEAINEFYFNKMKHELVRATKRNTIVDEKEIRMSFRRFFRSLSAINEEMYKDVINSQLPEEGGRTAIQKKEAAVKRQKAVLRRRHQLSQLYREQLEKVLRAESRELLKLEKLQAALDKEKGRRKSKLAREKKNKEKQLKLQKIADEKRLAEEASQNYEQGLRDEIAAKEEEKRLRREEAARMREYKRYEQLRKKYGDLYDNTDEEGFYDIFEEPESAQSYQGEDNSNGDITGAIQNGGELNAENAPAENAGNVDQSGAENEENTAVNGGNIADDGTTVDEEK